jgi:hypothetical protein
MARHRQRRDQQQKESALGSAFFSSGDDRFEIYDQRPKTITPHVPQTTVIHGVVHVGNKVPLADDESPWRLWKLLSQTIGKTTRSLADDL